MQTKTKKWHQRWWAKIFFVILTILLIFLVAFSFYVLDLRKKIKNQQQDGALLAYYLQKQKTQENAEGVNNYWIGSAKPKITIVEFGDFNCPLCAESYKTIREISLKYKKHVKIIFRDFPLRDSSINLSMAARCAGEQGLFWPMYDKLFQNQGQFETENLSILATQIGADISRFDECLDSNKYLNDIKKDFSDAERLNLAGTPTWFINGYKLEGSIPHDVFIELIEEMLSNS